jgi:hypothetical protein
MKTKIIFFLLIALFCICITKAQIKVNNVGRVTIGSLSDPTKNLDVRGTLIFRTTINNGGKLLLDSTGYNNVSPALYPEVNNTGFIGKLNNAFKNVYTYGVTNLSDSRQKENVRDISEALGIVMQLKGVKYDLKKEYAFNVSGITDKKAEAEIEEDRKNILGFIAQDVNKVLPEVIEYDKEKDIYGIDYTRIVPVLVEAIKEQQKQIEMLQNMVTLHEAEILALKEQPDTTPDGSKMKSTGSMDALPTINEVSAPALFQNTPNPFTIDTRIEYYLPSTILKASIIIHDLQGGEIKQTELQAKGTGHIIIHGSELRAGMYFYTLVADDRIIDTKRMILTE